MEQPVDLYRRSVESRFINGPGFTAEEIVEWAEMNSVKQL